MKPEVKEEYMKKLSAFGISEETLMSTWIDGEAEGEYKGFMKGMKKGRTEGRAEGIERGIQKGKAEGRVEGREEGLMTGARIQVESTVQNMYKHGMSVESIAEILGMEPSEVEATLKKVGKIPD